MLPSNALLRVAKDGSISPLLAALKWIGSLYIEVGPWRARYLEEALRLAYDPATPRDGFLLQTLLLLTIGLDGNCEQEKARQLLSESENLALQLSINSRTFAAVHGRGAPVLEESWRRTWWELYVVDGMIAGVHRHTNFLLFDFQADVALPCEEYQYLSGVSLSFSSCLLLDVSSFLVTILPQIRIQPPLLGVQSRVRISKH